MYANFDSPMAAKSLWTDHTVADDVTLQFFRGDNLFVWQYSRSPTINRYRYFIQARHIKAMDEWNLLDRLSEDGAFGCFTFEFEGLPLVSRDLLDSVAELTFLHRHTGLLDASPLQVLDIGAGYGRLAHRLLEAAPNVEMYWCVDAVPRSTFLCEFYLRYRGLSERSTVVPLPQLKQVLRPGEIDIAINIHSFSEMPKRAVAAWMGWVASLNVPTMLIVPNDPAGVFSREQDGRRLDCTDVLLEHGYSLDVREPTISDPGVREVLGVHDHFMLYRRRSVHA
jgi:SAM-dependent methyltransferase